LLSPLVPRRTHAARRVRLTYRWPDDWHVRLPDGAHRPYAVGAFRLRIQPQSGGADVTMETPPAIGELSTSEEGALRVWWQLATSQPVSVLHEGQP